MSNRYSIMGHPSEIKITVSGVSGVDEDPGAEEHTKSNPYSNLVERAVRYVGDRGGCVDEHALIAYVFGSSGPTEMWQPLLRQILATDERLLLRADERWALSRMPIAQPGGMLSDFVAIDVETTGLQPLRQRVIEVALVRFKAGEV